MNVVMLSPGYPLEMAYFTRGSPRSAPRSSGSATSHRTRCRPRRGRRWPTTSTSRSPTRDAVLAALHGLARHVRIDQVECLWEPYMILAARIREAFGLPGMTVEQTVPFRDKERMKQVLDAAGIRTPWHVEHDDRRRGVGGGRADRLPAHRQADRRRRLGRHLPGRLGRRSWPRCCRCCATCRRSASRSSSTPRSSPTTPSARTEGPVRERLLVPPATAADAHARVGQPGDDLAPRPDRRRTSRAAGRWARDVLAALGFSAGFTHMEWYRKDDGEVVFGEIGARPPGARVVDVMNYATDGDLYVGWAEAVVHGRMPAAGAALQRRQHLQAGAGFRPDHRTRGLDRLLGGVRRRGRRRRPAAGRGPAA